MQSGLNSLLKVGTLRGKELTLWYRVVTGVVLAGTANPTASDSSSRVPFGFFATSKTVGGHLTLIQILLYWKFPFIHLSMNYWKVIYHPFFSPTTFFFLPVTVQLFFPLLPALSLHAKNKKLERETSRLSEKEKKNAPEKVGAEGGNNDTRQIRYGTLHYTV